LLVIYAELLKDFCKPSVGRFVLVLAREVAFTNSLLSIIATPFLAGAVLDIAFIETRGQKQQHNRCVTKITSICLRQTLAVKIGIYSLKYQPIRRVHKRIF